MGLKYQFVLYLCMIPIILVLLVRKKKMVEYKNGKKYTNAFLVTEDTYYRKKMRKYRILKMTVTGSCFLGIIASLFLIARPYKTTIHIQENYNRDIMLCIDISYSVDELNLKLVRKLQDTVRKLKGERFGIVIFNTSPILLSPLTNDYEYILEILGQLQKSLEAKADEDYYKDDWIYLNSYLVEGTLIGSEQRGSSLIGDGLAACAYDFQNLEEERTRVIIFSTDNDLQGEPYVTLSEAASICKQNDIVVYGIGTKEMLEEHKASMKANVEKTGGKFYLEEDSGSVQQIVDSIEKEEKSMIKQGKEVRTEEQPMIPLLILLVSVSLLYGTAKITKI